MTELREALKQLASLRRQAEAEYRLTVDAEKAMQVTAEYANHRACLAAEGETARQIAETEAQVRNLTLQAFRETENKNPAPGASIKLYRRLSYKPEVALHWAEQNMPILVKRSLDARAFEKAVSGIGEKGECWETEYDPRATIAGDLSEYLQ